MKIKDNSKDTIRDVIGFLIAICGILIIVFIFAEPMFHQKELVDVMIEYKYKTGGIYESCYFLDSNENKYLLFGEGKYLRYEKLELNHTYTIEVTSHYLYPSLASHSEVKVG